MAGLGTAASNFRPNCLVIMIPALCISVGLVVNPLNPRILIQFQDAIEICTRCKELDLQIIETWHGSNLSPLGVWEFK